MTNKLFIQLCGVNIIHFVEKKNKRYAYNFVMFKSEIKSPISKKQTLSISFFPELDIKRVNIWAEKWAFCSTIDKFTVFFDNTSFGKVSEINSKFE